MRVLQIFHKGLLGASFVATTLECLSGMGVGAQ